ncbi:MAG TPA: adenylate/guanylate cyclase domain-containing protein [Azospirillaceae bacterium]|nr:adenylate/guanylate cyclase domain-containing protein [Azospirillaceae bacterium]
MSAAGVKRGAIRWRPVAAGVLLAHAGFVLALALYESGWLEPAELAVHDRGVILRAAESAPDGRFLVVGATEADLERFGFPLSDAVLARAAAKLRAAGALAVAIDVIRDRPVEPGADELAALLASDPAILWVYLSRGAAHRGVAPPAALRGTDRVGFGDMPVDARGVVRRMLLFQAEGDGVGTAMPLRMAALYLAPLGIGPEPDPADPGTMRLGRARLPPLRPDTGAYAGVDAGGYQIMLDYRDGPDAVPRMTLSDLMDAELAPGALAGRLVHVGVFAETLRDTFYTPFSTAGVLETATHGVVMQALATRQLLHHALDGRPATVGAGRTGRVAWIWAWSLLGAAVGAAVRTPVALAAGVLVVAAGLGGLWYAAFLSHVWLPAAAPALAALASAGAQTAYQVQREKTDRRTLMRLFSSHVSPAVAQELWECREAFLAGGRARPLALTATVLFTDIDGFTPISERLTPEQLLGWLNTYMEAMARLVMEHGGVVDKFIGDAVMAVFGVPVPRTSEAEIDADAERAVRCVLAMEAALEVLNRRWAAEGLPPVGISAGLFTGPLVAGSLGSSERLEYTVIGDTVNTAARLEAAAKKLPALAGRDSPVRAAVGEETWTRLRGRYVGVPAGPLQLKGKSRPVAVYRLVGPADTATEDRPGEETAPRRTGTGEI